MGTRTLGLCAALFLAAACDPANDVNGTSLDHGVDEGEPSSTKKATTSGGTDSNDDTAQPVTPSAPPPSATTTATTTAPPAPDADKDGFPDSVDCAPNDASIAGTLLLNDALAADNNFFTAATGFPAGDWVYSGALTQTRLAAAPDQTLFNKDAAITDAIISVTASSTDISSAFSPELRQMFITFQTKVNGGTLTGVGCGLEVDASANPTQQTSVVQLNGSPSHVTSTPLNRVARGAVQVNELFQMKGTLKNGLLTCEVTIGGNTTTTAQASVGEVAGAVGFFTNQTKALFKTANICKLK